MEFRNLKSKKCPVCDADVCAEGIETVNEWQRTYPTLSFRTHVNGQQWEWREFLCGGRVGWSPNFGREEMSTWKRCPNAPERKLTRERREQAVALLKEFLLTLKVDEEFRDAVRIPEPYG